MKYQNFFLEKIKCLKESNLYRTPKKNQSQYLDFCSNDYLNLSQSKVLKNTFIKAVEKYGTSSSASRYVNSNNNLCQVLEKNLSNLKKTQDCIVFGSGYLSGIGCVPALVDKYDLIIADKLIHSCLIDGAKLSNAKLLRFKHNNMAHCQEILENHRQNYKKCLIISETVFSMDGDLGNINELLDLAKKYNAILISDDAHGLGIVKKEYQNYDYHIQLGTLSKAAGGYGGYACASHLITNYLRNFARSAIYSTALPPAIIATNIKAIKIINKDTKLRKKALENANYFCDLMGLAKTESTIVPIIIGDSKKTLNIAKELKQSKFLVSAIRPPTVEIGTSRLRITFSTLQKKSNIKKLSNILLGTVS